MLKIEDYIITREDELNFVLNQPYISKKGKTKGQEQLRFIDYYSTLKGAVTEVITRLIGREINTDTINSCKELVHKLNALELNILCQIKE